MSCHWIALWVHTLTFRVTRQLKYLWFSPTITTLLRNGSSFLILCSMGNGATKQPKESAIWSTCQWSNSDKCYHSYTQLVKMRCIHVQYDRSKNLNFLYTLFKHYHTEVIYNESSKFVLELYRENNSWGFDLLRILCREV